MMQQYPKVKDASASWLGSIPSHWDCKKVGSLFSERKVKVSDKDYQPLSVAKIGVVPQLDTAVKTDAGDNRKLVCAGDFVINSRSDRKGSCGVSELDGSVSLINIVLKPRNEWNHKYVHYLMRSHVFSEEYYRYGRGIVADLWTTRFSEMKNILLPVPPHDEQDQIVRFLDWKASEINKLINIRKRQITELEELKRSKIGNIVMGQTFDVPPKETGVSWVKSIPAHWEEHALIQVAEEQQIKNTGMVEDNLLSLSYGKIINKDINTTDGLLPASFEGYQIINSGNIVLRLTDLQNDHRSLRTGLATQRGIITSAYTCLKARDNVLPEYLQLQLHVADLCKVFYGMGGGVRQSIGFKDIRRLIVAIPSLDEQKSILNAVSGIEGPINSVIAKYQEIILSLEELKTKLVSDVVTGKIDVRDVVIPDYEYVDEEVDTAETDDSEENIEEQEDE